MHTITNFVLLMQVSRWTQTSKDVFTNYLGIISDYGQIINNYVEITLLCLFQWHASIRSTQLEIIIENACTKDSQSVQYSDLVRMIFCMGIVPPVTV